MNQPPDKSQPTFLGRYIDLYRELCGGYPTLGNQEIEVLRRLVEEAPPSTEAPPESPVPYLNFVSDEPLEVIEANECQHHVLDLSTSRFRRLFNELHKLKRSVPSAIGTSIPKPDAAVATGAKSVQLSYFKDGEREKALEAFKRWLA